MNISIGILSAAVLLVLSALVAILARQAADRKRMLQLAVDLTELEKRLVLFNEGSQGVGKRLVEVERQMSVFASDQVQLQQRLGDDVVAMRYSNAEQLLHSGAPDEEIKQQSGLSDAEIELMKLIQRKGSD